MSSFFLFYNFLLNFRNILSVIPLQSSNEYLKENAIKQKTYKHQTRKPLRSLRSLSLVDRVFVLQNGRMDEWCIGDWDDFFWMMWSIGLNFYIHY